MHLEEAEQDYLVLSLFVILADIDHCLDLFIP